MPKVYTLDELKSWTPERRLALYTNAKKHPDGAYIVQMIDDNGLSLSTSWMSIHDPVFRQIHDIAWSPEGKRAAVEATEKGWPAISGVDLLLKEKLGDKYRSEDKGTLSAGSVVAEVMRHLGYREAGTGKCPEGCVAKTGMTWKPFAR